MRSPIEAGSSAWLMRIFRPWFVATFAGMVIGTVLLRIEPPEATGSYPELAPRSAVYDAPAFDPTTPFVEPAGLAPSPLSTTPSARASLFDPAAPISASAELTPDEGALP